MLKRYIGDRDFYRRILGIAIPIMIQNGITNFVSMLDNLMVGQVGTIQMSGVSIANQLIFIYNICIFGAAAGAGIFTAQFHGKQDHDGIRHAFRFKILICFALSLIGIGVFLVGGGALVKLYLQGEGDPKDAAMILGHGIAYLRIMLIGLIPFAITNAYSSTLRECGQAVVPMAAGIWAVLVNLVLNYILIFGHFGAPALGIEGAAIATVIARFVETAIVMIWTHRHHSQHPFIKGVYNSLHIPGQLLGQIIRKGTPLLLNEFLWVTGMSIINQSYSTCSLDVVPAMNIATTISNLSSTVYISIGTAIGILMGQILGSGVAEEEVRSTNRKLLFMGVASGVVFGILLLIISDLFPHAFNTTQAVRELAATLIRIGALLMPFYAFTFATFFTLRSGGQAWITFAFDGGYVWSLCVPLAFCLSRFTDLPIIPLYIICQCPEFLKCILGSRMLRRGKWIKNLTIT